jgi:hypothetical protein
MPVAVEKRETITCPHCSFKVQRVSRNGNSKIDMDMTAYSMTCRRAKDLPALDGKCPELQGAIAK